MRCRFLVSIARFRVSHLMITQNYCASVGSLVHRAQGYKKLKEDGLMASKFYIPVTTTKNRSYYLVSESFTARVKSNPNQFDSLKKGSLGYSVKTIRNPTSDIELKIVDTNNKNNASEEIILRCPPEKLIKVNEKVWNLVAPIESAIEKIKIVKDSALCEELCNIDIGSSVIVFSCCIGIVVSKRTPRKGFGVLFEVVIQVSSICYPSWSLNTTLAFYRIITGIFRR